MIIWNKLYKSTQARLCYLIQHTWLTTSSNIRIPNYLFNNCKILKGFLVLSVTVHWLKVIKVIYRNKKLFSLITIHFKKIMRILWSRKVKWTKVQDLKKDCNQKSHRYHKSWGIWRKTTLIFNSMKWTRIKRISILEIKWEFLRALC